MKEKKVQIKKKTTQRLFKRLLKIFKMPSRHKKIIVIAKLATPKKVTLPNDRILYGKYKRVKRNMLP